MRPVDPDLLKAYTLRLWKYKQGEMVSLMVYLGDRLGLYRGMAGADDLTSEELAERTGLTERWVREWLLGQAAAGLVTRTPEGAYRLEPEGERLLVDDRALGYAAGAFIGGYLPEHLDAIAESFRTGRGLSYGDMGERIARQMDRMNAVWVSDYLLAKVLPLAEGVIARLEAGAVVIDVGCGGGMTVEAIARRFPETVVAGYDPSGPAVGRAARRLGGLTNASVEQLDGEQIPPEPRADLILALDCMHDMPFPDRVASTIRRALRDDGVWLIKDTKCSEVFEKNLRNPMLALQYGYSVCGCLPSGASAEGGAALGTLGLPPAAMERLVREAGFTSFREIRPKDDPTHIYYDVRV